jgi:hypothetical protein
MNGKNILPVFLISACFLAGCSSKNIYTVEIPEDFKVTAIAGGVAPGTTITKLEIDAQGNAVYSEASRENRAKGEFEQKDKFKLAGPALRDIYRTIKKNDFFSLEKNYKNENALDGSFAELTVTYGGKTHKVRTQNISVESFDKVMIAVNIAAPGMNKVIYNAIMR